MIKVERLERNNIMRQLIASILLIGVALALPVYAQNEAQDVLIERGQYWLGRGDVQRANEAWEKLLLLDANSITALKGLAETALLANQTQVARDYIERLKIINPQHSAIVALEQRVLLQSQRGASALTEARQAAQTGSLDKAVTKYQELLGSQVPSGELGREYYTYLGYTNEGLAEAIKGLERLEKEQPNNVQVSLSLAKHMARQEKNRLQAISRLARLAELPGEVGSDAKKSWREAILWLGPPNRSQETYYRDYLAKNPDDEEIKTQLAEGRRRSAIASVPAPVDPMIRRTQQALRDLDTNPSRAEQELNTILKQRPNDANALGGLGVIRLRQGRIDEAYRLLTRAQQRGGKGWGQALQQVEQQKMLLIASQLQAQGNELQAEQQYKLILSKHPESTEALLALVDTSLKSGNLEQAQRYLSQLDSLMRKISADSKQQAAYHLSVARFDAARGDVQLAQAGLELALARFPLDPWIRLELARFYFRQGNLYDADLIMQGLSTGAGVSVDTIKAMALYSAEKEDWQGVLQLLSTVPTASLDTELIRMQKQADFRQQVSWAKQRCQIGQSIPALDALSQQVIQLKDDTSLVMALVDAYMACKQPEKALLLVDRQILVVGEEQRVDLQLLRAGVLLQDKQVVQAEQLLAQIAQEPVTLIQKQRYEELAMYLAIQQAELFYAYGRADEALNLVLPWVETNPSNLELSNLVIRIYLEQGKSHLAKRLYDAVLPELQMSEDPKENINLARLAYQIGDISRGDAILDTAVTQASNNEQMLVEIAKTYKQAGRMSKAADTIKKAMAPYKQK